MSQIKQYRKTVLTEAALWDGDVSGLPDEWRAAIEIDSLGGLIVRTIDGPARLLPGGYLVRGNMGEFYPVRQDIFEATYEVDE